MGEDIAFTERFVATDDTRRRLARAFVAQRHRMRVVWILYPLVFVLFALIFLTSMDPRFSLGTRVVWSLIFGLVPTLVLVGVFATLAYVMTLRGGRTRVFEGAVLESGFGEKEFVLRGPLSESRISYQAVRSIDARGDFVFLRQHGMPVVSVIPRDLFPDDAIERIRSASTAGQPGTSRS